MVCYPTAEEKLTAAIMPNDIVKHRPTGEEWVVCGVDYGLGLLVPCGYLFPCIVQIADCDLVEKRYSKEFQSIEQIEALKKSGLTRFIDVASAMFHGIF
jgi:hypothetical protein